VAITYTITERGSVMGCSPPLKSLSTLCGPAPLRCAGDTQRTGRMGQKGANRKFRSSERLQKPLQTLRKGRDLGFGPLQWWSLATCASIQGNNREGSCNSKPLRSKVNIEMSRQVTIETPFPTIEETARTLGVSVAQAERVQKILADRRPRRRPKANGRLRRASRYAAKRASKRA
jgi:hypothetical protein